MDFISDYSICQKCGVRRFLVFHPRKHPSLVRSTDSCSGPICRGRGADVAARCAASIFREIENVISEFPPSSAGSASSSSSSPAVRCGDRFPADMRQTFNEAHVKSFHRKPEFHVGNVRQASGQDTVVPIPLWNVPGFENPLLYIGLSCRSSKAYFVHA